VWQREYRNYLICLFHLRSSKALSNTLKADVGHAGFIDRTLSAGALYHLDELKKEITEKYLQAE